MTWKHSVFVIMNASGKRNLKLIIINVEKTRHVVNLIRSYNHIAWTNQLYAFAAWQLCVLLARF
jgi:hypothetical protein